MESANRHAECDDSPICESEFQIDLGSGYKRPAEVETTAGEVAVIIAPYCKTLTRGLEWVEYKIHPRPWFIHHTWRGIFFTEEKLTSVLCGQFSYSL